MSLPSSCDESALGVSGFPEKTGETEATLPDWPGTEILADEERGGRLRPKQGLPGATH